MLPTIETARLSLRPLTLEIINALLEDDAEAFRALTGSSYPANAPIPPLMEDALPYIRSWLLADPGRDAWSWVGIDRETAQAVVHGGLGFGLDDRAVATLGYSVYPVYEGRGYASELATGLVQWLFREHATAAAVEATIPAWHPASIRVAEKAGMTLNGTTQDPEVGEVLVYRVDRPRV